MSGKEAQFVEVDVMDELLRVLLQCDDFENLYGDDDETMITLL